MSAMGSHTRALVIVLAAVAWACTTPVPLYPGPTRPRTEVGIVSMATNGAVLGVDRRELEGRRYALLPGDHTVAFRVIVQGSEIHPNLRGQRKTGQCEAVLHVESGHEYHIDHTRPRSPLVEYGERQLATNEYVTRYMIDVRIVDYGPDGEERGHDSVMCRW